MRKFDFVDTLTVSNFESEKLTEFVLSGMYTLTERGLVSQKKPAQFEKIQDSFLWNSVLVLQKFLDVLFPLNSRLRAIQSVTNTFWKFVKKTA